MVNTKPFLLGEELEGYLVPSNGPNILVVEEPWGMLIFIFSSATLMQHFFATSHFRVPACDYLEIKDGLAFMEYVDPATVLADPYCGPDGEYSWTEVLGDFS